MIANFISAVKKDIAIILIVFLLLMLSFAAGFLTAKYLDREPIQFIQTEK